MKNLLSWLLDSKRDEIYAIPAHSNWLPDELLSALQISILLYG